VLTAQGEQGPVSEAITLTVEELKPDTSDLLPDRGGLLCGAAGSDGAWAGWLLLLVLAVRTRRCSR